MRNLFKNFTVKSTFFASIAFGALFTMNQASASTMSYVASGNCTYDLRLADAVNIISDGSLAISPRSQTNVRKVRLTCSLPAPPSIKKGFLAVFAHVYTANMNSPYGKTRCNVRFSGYHGEYGGVVYDYPVQRRDFMTFLQPSWLGHYARSVLVCDLNNSDRLHGFEIIEY